MSAFARRTPWGFGATPGSRSIAALAGACGFSLGVWAAFGTVALLGPETSPRLILPASPWVLLAAALAAFAFVLIRRPTARDAAPLWLPAIALLPWLPLPIPAAALLWTGPLARGLVVLSVAGVVVPLISHARTKVRDARTKVRAYVRHPTLAFGLAAILYVGAAWKLSPILPSGDEPHYLAIADSLFRDGDLKIENNHAAPGYLTNLIGDLKPDYLRRGRDGQIYSIHAPGLPALVLPAFALAGYPGVVVFLALLSAAGAALAWRAAFALTNDAAAAWIGWAAVALSAPFFFQAFTIFPDAPAAVIVMLVVYALVCEEWLTLPPRLAFLGAALAFLPWLHTRYTLIAVSAAIVIALRVLSYVGPNFSSGNGHHVTAQARAWAYLRLLAFLAIPIVSAAAWLLMFQQIYGTFDPRAPYGGAPEMRLPRIPVGLTGLLIDQQFGLLPNAPVYLVAIAAVVSSARRHRRLTLEIAAISAPYVITVAAFHMWWAGLSSPARFLVPVLLPVALPIADAWKRHASATPRAVTLTLLCLSVGITAILTCAGDGGLLYNTRDGFARWLDWIVPTVNLAYALPSLFQGSVASAWIRAAIWGVVLAAAWLGFRAIERRAGWLSLPVVTALTVVTVSVGASAAWTASANTPIEQGASGIVLVEKTCGTSNPKVFRVAAAGFSASRLDAMGFSLFDAGRRPQLTGGPMWTGHDLAPGRYRVLLDSGLNVTGTVTVALGKPRVAFQQCTFSEHGPGPTDCILDLPSGATSIWMTPDAAMRGSIEGIRLQTVAGPPGEDCALRAGRALATPAGVIFTQPEGVSDEAADLWVLGGAVARLTVVPHGDRALVLRNGPNANRVRVTMGGKNDERRLAPGELITIRLYTTQRRSAVPVTIWSESGFRPAEVQPGTRDFRWLGVWVEMR